MPSHTTSPWLRDDAFKRNNIDFLRFFLATLVIFSHCYALTNTTGSGFLDSTEPLYLFSHAQRTFGGIAVDFFFILSGFLITHSWLRSSSLASFLLNRVLRIYPAFLASIVFGTTLVCVFSPLGTDYLSRINLRFIIEAVTLGFKFPAGFPGDPSAAVNGSLWSIRYEFWCYIGVACIGLFSILAKRRALVLAMLLFSIAGSAVYEIRGMHLGLGRVGPFLGGLDEWTRLLPCYLAGMAFYLYRDTIRWHPLLFLIACGTLIAGLLTPHAMSIVSPIAGAYVLFSLAFTEQLPLQHFGKYGDFSYGMYVYAFPIQQAFVARLGTSIQPAKFFALAFACTLVVSIISWHAIEKPCLKLKKRKTSVATTP